ncbi:hypothetical protein B9Z55_002181 [Caenorhabditis nigoni]|uniref:Uncharacterized protein n=2 Tax=Caenorhabditis nigoni TaxID=1611254 RepID=A0A2G5VJB6_9PELO|nr:hypothetical protein B9Z55_002181 [Caenorhabditis nigoni]
MYSDCFQQAPGWYHLTATCIFPLTQFERNYSTAAQMCGAVNHSIGYRETNWLIALQLLELFMKEKSRDLMKLYWTGLIVKNDEVIVVESADATDDTMNVADFTSMYNPLWAEGQPPEDLSSRQLAGSCIALDLRNSSNFGWRALPCSYQLPILCQNYACLPGTFRCADNSKCIPSSFQHDGFKDCLDGSDEFVDEVLPISSSTPNSILSSILRSNPIYEWPMIVSSGGVLSPTTLRYGKGECTHRWTVLSPNDHHFIIWIKWMSPVTSTTIAIEGKDQNGRIFLNSRNATSSITLTSSSFLLTASNTDTRKIEFQVHYQDADNSLCKLTEQNQLFFNSELIPMSCNYHFSTQIPSSYVALLIRKCEGNAPDVATIQFNNMTISLAPRQSKKLLIIPSNSLNIDVKSSWPDSNTKLDIQFLELKAGNEEKEDVFLIDTSLEIEWIPRSSEVCMSGQFRTLTVNMIMTSSEDSEGSESVRPTWDVKKFAKSCSEDNVQIVSKNHSAYLTNSRTFSGFGPTTVVIHQSAEPFEFHAFYSIQETRIEDSGRFLDENNSELESATSLVETTTNHIESNGICKLPSVVYGYIMHVSDEMYPIGTIVFIKCNEGYLLSDNASTLQCTGNGTWEDDNKHIYPSEHPTVRCLPINCPSQTSVEIEKQLDPDTWETSYGIIRRYLTAYYFSFQPFCVCGDNSTSLNSWTCYDDADGGIPNACILPQTSDAIFFPPGQYVFRSGEPIYMNCMLCNTVMKPYTCEDGLWKTLEGNVQPYGSFECRCQDEPGFQDPCKPYGSYVQHSGFYSCDCINGYKFYNGTCQDRNECEEESDFCDDHRYCQNTQGGFTCDCPTNYHLYNASANVTQWSRVSEYLIDGYSCVETTCVVEKDWEYKYDIKVIYPPDPSTDYKSGTAMDYLYATNICDSDGYNCVYQFQQSCIQDIWITEPNPAMACPEYDLRLRNFSYPTDGLLSFHIFKTLDVSCLNKAQTMIGRPKVFCNAHASWEILPVCIYQSCSNITQFITWPLIIQGIDRPLGGDGFEITTVVNLACADGYRMPEGNGAVTCILRGTNYEWAPEIPKCISTTTTSSYTSSYTVPAAATLTPNVFTFFPFLSSSGTTQSSRDPSTESTWQPTGSEGSFIAYDDVVIEGSMKFEERSILDQQELWTHSGDWIWTPSGCIIHQWTFPVSFLVTSIPIQLTSDQIELLIDVSQCNSSVQVGVTSSSDGFIPSISEFRPVMNTTSSGSFVVKLKNLKPNLAVSITANGYVQICGVTIRESVCDEVDYDGLHLTSSKPFSMRRYLSATCINNQRLPAVNGYCDSRRGWVIQRTPCLCETKPICATPAPIAQFDQSDGCSLNVCQNGECVSSGGGFVCICNAYFIRDTLPNGDSYCRPNHCELTSQTRNSGYDCDTGLDDDNIKCTNISEYSVYGDFCQYQGSASNNSFIYMLKSGSENAIATNVCDSVHTEYAIPGVRCLVEPTTTPQPHEQSGCNVCHAGNCEYTPPPFDGGALCKCGPGQYGRSCGVSKFCFNETNNHQYLCQNGGTCDLDKRMCNCTSMFEGDHCEIAKDLDTCYGEKDCANGVCHNENGNMYCNCFDGYIPDSYGNCTILWDMCQLNNPCQQGGKCIFNQTSGEQNCDCSSTGWLGTYCEIQPKLDDCSVCQNSKQCFNNFTLNVRCQCDLGFSGAHCLDTVNDCNFHPCFNGGKCDTFNYIDVHRDLIESYNCTCPTGFSGTNCEIKENPDCSQLITCENGGTCSIVSPGSAVCNCTDQFFGTYCEQRCSDQCSHSYGCHESNGTIFCECYDGFSSPLCDQVDDVCKANVLLCQNSGTCNSTTSECDCPEFFSGTYCETNTDKCQTNSIICENNGKCVPQSGICECRPNFTGDRCENQIHSCRDITCFNGGTCLESNGTCACIPGSTGDRCQDLGQPCIITMPDGSTSPYCLHNGNCTVTENGATCDCNGTDYTGRRCDIKANFNFNLVFNGLGYAPDIVSKPFFNVSIAQFTICSFVQYNHPAIESNGAQDGSIPTLLPWLIARGYGKSQKIVFDNKGFFICDPDDTCTRDEPSKRTNYRPTTISANTWHHFCIVSPENLTSPSYTIYLDGVQLLPQLAPIFNPGPSGYLQLAPPDLTNKTDNRFVGMISMTQLYIIRLNETQIGQLAYDCYTTINETSSEIASNTLISWNGGFTRVSSSNPGVFIDPSGICSSVKCMFGRQANSNNYNSTGSCAKDRISPTVLRCPLNKYVTTSEDFIKVKWSDDEISFFDNIGVVRVEVNYHNGQQFGIGITAVRYIAFDAAGNSAECTFDVVVVQKACPSESQIFVEGGTIRFGSTRMAPFTSKVAFVECNDKLYPVENRPKFYVCDIMGDFQYGGWLDDTQRKYYLPACGKTVPAEQAINGTVVGDGTCEQVYRKLYDIIWTSVNCDKIGSCHISIRPPCNKTSIGSTADVESGSYALQYTFSTKNATETISTTVLSQLQTNFTLVRQDSTVDCDPSYPIHDTTGTITTCVSCAEGTFANVTQNQCMECPVNTYRPSSNPDQLSCTQCPDGTTTGDVTGAFDESQCYKICPIGQYESNGVCLPCPIGTFGPTEGLQRCICCGFDISTYGDDSKTFDDCTKVCDPGQEMIRSADKPEPYCQDCDVGFYKEVSRGACIQCPRGLITSSKCSKSINDCNVLNCIDANTRRNGNITAGPNTTYSQMCITCEQGTFQNQANSDHCIPCTDLSEDVIDVPVTCQSTCSADIPTEGCNCQLQSSGNNSMIIRNCVPEIKPAHQNSNAIKIVLPIVFGVLLIIVLVVLFCFRKQIIAWVRKTDTNDNQHVALSHWNEPTSRSPRSDDYQHSPNYYQSETRASVRVRGNAPPAPTIPRPNLRIITNPKEMDQLPPLPSSSTPSFHVDSSYKHVGFASGLEASSGMRHLGSSNISSLPPLNSSNNVFFEANGSPKIIRSREEASMSDDSSLGSFF